MPTCCIVWNEHEFQPSSQLTSQWHITMQDKFSYVSWFEFGSWVHSLIVGWRGPRTVQSWDIQLSHHPAVIPCGALRGSRGCHIKTFSAEERVAGSSKCGTVSGKLVESCTSQDYRGCLWEGAFKPGQKGLCPRKPRIYFLVYQHGFAGTPVASETGLKWQAGLGYCLLSIVCVSFLGQDRLKTLKLCRVGNPLFNLFETAWQKAQSAEVPTGLS